MALWRLFTDLLGIMIENHEDIFLEKQNLSSGGSSTPNSSKRESLPPTPATLMKQNIGGGEP